MMPQARIRRMAVQSAAYELRVHPERDYVDMDTCLDIADRANEILRNTSLWGFMVDYEDLDADEVVDILDIDI